jgi:hypothetical protein
MSKWHEWDCGGTQISSHILPSHPTSLRSAHHPSHRVALGEEYPIAPWSDEIRPSKSAEDAPKLDSRNEIEVVNEVGWEDRRHGQSRRGGRSCTLRWEERREDEETKREEGEREVRRMSLLGQDWTGE